MNNISIELKDKETQQISQPVSLQDLIYNQNDIEFQFGEYGDDDYGTLPYKDFLFFCDDYEVIVKVDDDE